MAINWDWLDERLKELGISRYALKNHFNFNPETIRHWDEGTPPRAFTVRKLARILEVSVKTLVKKLGVEPKLGVPR